jgi:alpha-tubulin suppressor-like RCC1 family protein
MLRKIACNATNSAAIDIKGNVYVWGAGKYGLLGNPKQKNSIAKPIML